MKEKILEKIDNMYSNVQNRLDVIQLAIENSGLTMQDKQELTEKLQSKVIIGIIYNYKGISEKNYLIYGGRLREINKKLFDEVYNDKKSEVYYTANKTALFIRFDFFAEVEKFLEGRLNEEVYSFEDSDFFDEDKDSPMKAFKQMMMKGDD